MLVRRDGETGLRQTHYLNGAVFGLAAATIWASWSVLTRLAVTTGLDASDIAALRFGVAGLLLAPVVLRRGLARDRLGWPGLGVLVAGVGVPYVLIAATGLRFAPARDGGALNPGCMPLFVALLAAGVLREKLSTARISGLSLILAGAVIIIGWHAGGRWSASRALGDGLFLTASFLTAGFTVVMRRAQLDPLHAVALVSTGSLVVYLPIYFALHGARLARIPLADLAVQALFQGVVVTILSLVLYGRAVALLGAAAGSAFGALVPALAALFAIPLLGEWPSQGDWAGIVLISAGVYLASGGTLPRRVWHSAALSRGLCDYDSRATAVTTREPSRRGAGRSRRATSRSRRHGG
ncbi:MAG TPA: DMT family transporter [Stellaceae bacterium]|nr:DMT family transporter [Stellaceae bacterium]